LYRGQVSLVAVTLLPDSAFDSGRETHSFDARFGGELRSRSGRPSINSNSRQRPSYSNILDFPNHFTPPAQIIRIALRLNQRPCKTFGDLFKDR
jgi:hypothetical protein